MCNSNPIDEFVAGWRNNWPSGFIYEDIYSSVGIPNVDEHKFKIHQQGDEDTYASVLINLTHTDDGLVLTCNGRRIEWPSSPDVLEDLYRQLTDEITAQIESDEECP